MGARHTIIQNARKSIKPGPAYLVYDFNQRHTPQYKQSVDPTTQKGTDFCAGLALEWLVLRGAGKDYDYDRTKEVLLDPGAEPMQVQKVYVKGHSRAFDQVGLKEEWHKTTNHAVQATPLMDAASQPGMYFLQIRHTSSEGHVVAFTTHSFSDTGRAINYFDANLGSFFFGCRDDFKNWFDWVISQPLLENDVSYESYYAHHWTLFRLKKG